MKSELFFSLIYKDSNGDSQNFFPDFVVQYMDGTTGIFDPKDGFTLEKDRPKHVVFAQYIEELRTKWKKVICGFIRVE